MLSRALLIAASLTLAACAATSPSTEVTLYTADVREHGLDCDATFRETMREPTRSSVRLVHGPTKCLPDDLRFLTMGVLIELARTRGFDYCVDLTGEIPAADAAAAWMTERTLVVGFLNDPETDLARAFPEHYSAHESYVVMPVDSANLPRALRASRRWTSP